MAKASALGALAAVMLNCGGPGVRQQQERPSAARFSANGVEVTLRIVLRNRTAGRLVTTFTPPDGFHLYSVRLPPDGINGVGRPIRIIVTGSLTSDGVPTTRSSERQVSIPGVERPLLAYRAGPVTTVLPIRSGPRDIGPAVVRLSFAACSETRGCLPPVIGHQVALCVTRRYVSMRPCF